jgi:hypothetical protein
LPECLDSCGGREAHGRAEDQRDATTFPMTI